MHVYTPAVIAVFTAAVPQGREAAAELHAFDIRIEQEHQASIERADNGSRSKTPSSWGMASR